MKHFINREELEVWLRENPQPHDTEVWRFADGSYAVGSASSAGPEDGDGVDAGTVADYLED